ncbi:hypothetical protein KKHLCK_16530 [Candidatus Electrothrix laxa]
MITLLNYWIALNLLFTPIAYLPASSDSNKFVVAQQKLTTTDVPDGAVDSFGRSISLSADGGTALIKVGWDDEKGDSSRFVYIFTRAADGTWTQSVKLTPEDETSKSDFGSSLSLSADGSAALIGDYIKDNALIFIHAADGTWKQQTELTAADGEGGEYFGGSVSLSADGGTALIGAVWDDEKGRHSGSAYVFTRESNGTWMQQAKLTAADGTTSAWFGNTLSLSADGRTALIGAEQAGAAYIFTHTPDGTWKQQAKLLAADGRYSNFFGSSVSLSADGKTALIGAYQAEGNDGSSGSAYVFIRDTDNSWTQKTKLIGSNDRYAARFGKTVFLSKDGRIALINGASVNPYIFTCSSDGFWSQQAQMITDDGNSLGDTLALSAKGNIALIKGFDRNKNRNAVYVFTDFVQPNSTPKP